MCDRRGDRPRKPEPEAADRRQRRADGHRSERDCLHAEGFRDESNGSHDCRQREGVEPSFPEIQNARQREWHAPPSPENVRADSNLAEQERSEQQAEAGQIADTGIAKGDACFAAPQQKDPAESSQAEADDCQAAGHDQPDPQRWVN